MCCCTKYTIKQLIEQGYVIEGAKLVNGKVEVSASKGNRYKVDVTKRSAVTISKGLKLSREQKMKLKEKDIAKQIRKKEVQKEKEIRQKERERVEKEKARAEKERLKVQKEQQEIKKKIDKKVEQYLRNRKRATVKKTRALFVLEGMDSKATEYHHSTEYTYRVYMRSKEAITEYKRVLIENAAVSSLHMIGKDDDIENIKRDIARRGMADIRVCLRYPIERSEHNVAVAHHVWYSYENYCESINFIMELLSVRGYVVPENCVGRMIGSNADGEELTLDSFSWMRKMEYYPI